MNNYLNIKKYHGIYFNNLPIELYFNQKTFRLNHIIEMKTGDKFIGKDNIYLYQNFMKLYDIFIKRKISGTFLNYYISQNGNTYENYVKCQNIYDHINKNFRICFPEYNLTEKLKSCLRNHNLTRYICYRDDDKFDKSKMRFEKCCCNTDKCNIEYYSCICSEYSCRDLMIIRHEPSKKCFAIGSECYKKFNLENSSIYNILYYNDHQTGNRVCESCNVKLYTEDISYNNIKKNFFKTDIGCFKNIWLCVYCLIKSLPTSVQKYYDYFKENIFEKLKEYNNYKNKCIKCDIPLHYKDSKKYKRNTNRYNDLYCSQCHYKIMGLMKCKDCDVYITKCKWKIRCRQCFIKYKNSYL